MAPPGNNLPLFLGHFHPLLVHLPIGGLMLLGFLEVVAGLKRWKEAAQISQWILGFVTGTACLSAAVGWMLAQNGGYDAQLLRSHRVLGIAVSASCLVTLLLRQRGWLRAYRASLTVTLVALAIASHLGGSMIHGRGFLTRFAPKPILTFLARPTIGRAKSPDDLSPALRPVFASLIQPILRERCSDCHGPEKHKADLRLDNLEDLLRGGRNGPVVRPGLAKDSPLVQRVLLPLDAEGHMPPDGSVQPTAAEIAILDWWINVGTPVDRTPDDLKPGPEIRRLLQVVSRRPQTAN